MSCSPTGGDLERAQTSPIGIVLIISITMIAAIAIVVFGTAALEDTQQNAEIGQAEQSLTQFDSRAAQVALGESDRKRINLGDGDYEVNSSAGSVNITHVNWDNEQSTEVILPTTDLGAVTYKNGETVIAYQGGGVWRQDPGGASRMVSPPDFHYRDRTLTFPIITIHGDTARSGSTRARVSEGTTVPIFPNASNAYDGENGPLYANPTGNGSVMAEIESEYCEGWQSYFESRSEGAIPEGGACDEGEEDTVIVDLTIPFQEAFANTLTYSDILNCNPADNCPDNERADRPSVSPAVDREIANCEDDSTNCLDRDELTDEEIDHNGGKPYYINESTTIRDVTFNTSEEDVMVVIDGYTHITGDNDIVGDGEVQILLRGEYDLKDGDPTINKDGSANQLQIYVHSSVDEITHDGKSHLTGVVYAPNTDFVQNGNGDVVGAVIARSITDNGGSSTWEYDESLENFETDLVGSGNPITFLHVTRNDISVDFN